MADTPQNQTSTASAIPQFSASDDTANEAMAVSVGQSGVQGLQILRQLLGSTQEDVRFWAIRGLWANGSASAEELIISALQDSNEMVRNGAALALGELHAEQAVVPLADLLAAAPATSGDYAADALRKIGSASGQVLIRALGHERAEVRVRAAKALISLEYRSAIAPLIHALDDDSYLVAHYAQEALARLGVGQMVYFSTL